MELSLLKRTTYIVQNAKKSADFFTQVFGWTIWYDNILKADHRFPPVGRSENSKVRLIIMHVKDAKIGRLGLLEYVEPRLDADINREKSYLKVGDPILVIENEEIDELYQRASDAGARIISPPVDWTVPGPNKESSIQLRTLSFFDPNGIYMEISAHPNRVSHE